MDDLDRQLLRELQRDADRSLLDFGEEVGLSASAVQRRIARLKSQGIITGLHAKLDPQRLGLAVTIVTTVRFERDAADSTTTLLTKLRTRSEVQMMHTLAGQIDLLIVTVVREVSDYTSGVLADLEADPNVTRLETNVSLGVIKASHELPISQSLTSDA